ncbi:MAG: hypothetical protein ABJB66_07370 [Gemmatimonadaceae bacterium]
MHNNIFLAAGFTAIVTATACASAPISTKARADLNDPRMLCAKTELSRLGYNVDNSFRRPGRYVATKTFPIVTVHRVAISAAIDSTDNDLEVWARVLRRDGITSANITAQPPTSMLVDAMEVENKCDSAK